MNRIGRHLHGTFSTALPMEGMPSQGANTESGMSTLIS